MLKVSATELARRLGDFLGRVRFRGESFIIERNGSPVALLKALPPSPDATVKEALAAWCAASEPDPGFADVLERIVAADRPPENPWVS